MIARTSTRVAAGIAVLAIVAAACGGSSDSDGGADPTTAATEAAAEPTDPTDPVDGSDADASSADPSSDAAPGVVVPAALEFEADLVGGGTIDARSLAGLPTVFWFWAPT